MLPRRRRATLEGDASGGSTSSPETGATGFSKGTSGSLPCWVLQSNISHLHLDDELPSSIRMKRPFK